MSFEWVKEFPGTLWETFVSNAKQNLPEFVGEVKSGVTSIAKGTGDIVKVIVSPLKAPLVLIAVIGIIILVFWKRIERLA